MMSQLFFNCDWGTTHFRLRLVDSLSGEILQELRTSEGVANLYAGDSHSREARFQAVLRQHVSKMTTTVGEQVVSAPVLISGMASSSIGWRELPYAQVPFSLSGEDLSFARLEQESADFPHPVYLFSGLASERDVMRGEEMELIGWGTLSPEFLEQNESFWAVLPGTHSKHVKIRQKTIVDFQTHMTGELFQVLGRHSSLRHSAGDMTALPFTESTEVDWKAAFQQGVEQAAVQGLGASLFQVRARQVLCKESLPLSAAFFSGLLIGAELSVFLATPQTEKIILIAAAELSPLYELAFAQLQLTPRIVVTPAADLMRLTALGQYQSYRKICSTEAV